MRLAPGLKLTSLFSILILILILGGGSGPVQAQLDAPALGITIDTSTLIPTPDPFYEFDFKLSLTTGFTLVSGDNITIYGIGFTNFGSAGSPLGFTAINSPYSWSTTVASNSVNPSLTNFTFAYLNSSNTSATASTGPLFLGDFFVLTTIPYDPSQPTPPDVLELASTPLDYTSHAHFTGPPQSPFTSMGITTPVVVPEPSSLILVGVGLVIALAWAYRCRAARIRLVVASTA